VLRHDDDVASVFVKCASFGQTQIRHPQSILSQDIKVRPTSSREANVCCSEWMNMGPGVR